MIAGILLAIGAFLRRGAHDLPFALSANGSPAHEAGALPSMPQMGDLAVAGLEQCGATGHSAQDSCAWGPD